ATEGRPYMSTSKRRDHFFSEPSNRLVIERWVRDPDEVCNANFDEPIDLVAYLRSRSNQCARGVLLGCDSERRRPSSQQLVSLFARLRDVRRSRPGDFYIIDASTDRCAMFAQHVDLVPEPLWRAERVPLICVFGDYFEREPLARASDHYRRARLL